MRHGFIRKVYSPKKGKERTVRDPRTEAWLEGEGVEWEYIEQLPIALIDEAKSLANQARVEKLDPGLVADYETQLKAGAKFPGIVVYVQGNRYVTIDGNHRYFAYKGVSQSHTGAYLVKTTDRYILERLTRSANQMNGKRASEREALTSAVALVQKHGRTIAEVAAAFGIPPSRLGKALNVSETRNRLRDMQMERTADAINTSAAQVLHAIGNDRVLKEAAIAVAEANVPVESVADLAREVNTARTEMDQLMVVKRFTETPEYQQRKAMTRGGKQKMTANRDRVEFLRAFGLLRSALAAKPTREKVGLTDDIELARLQGEWAQMEPQLKGLLYGAREHGTNGSTQGNPGGRAAALHH